MNKEAQYLIELSEDLNLDPYTVEFFASYLGRSEYYDALPSILEEYKFLDNRVDQIAMK